MDAATVALLAIVGVIVAAIALHLIAIAASLARIGSTLGKVKGGVQAVAGQTAPINTLVGGLAGDVSAIDDDLEGLLQLVADAQAAAAAAHPPAPRRAPVVAVTNDLDEMEVDLDDDEPVISRRSMREAVGQARAGAGV